MVLRRVGDGLLLLALVGVASTLPGDHLTHRKATPPYTRKKRGPPEMETRTDEGRQVIKVRNIQRHTSEDTAVPPAGPPAFLERQRRFPYDGSPVEFEAASMSPDPLSPDALKLSSSSQENGEEDEYDEDAAQFRGGTVDVPKSMVTLKRRTLQRLIREIGLQDNRIGSPDRLFIDKKAGITYRRELAREGGRSPYFEAFKEACRMQPPKVCDMKKYRLDYSQASTLLRSGGRFAQVDMQLVPGEEAREEDLLHLPRAKTEEGQKIGAFLDEFFTGLAWKQRLDTYQSGHTRLCQNLLEECRETITWIASSRPRMCGESHIQKVGCTTGNSFALFQDFDKWDPPIISKHRRKRMKVKETPKEREMRLRKRAKIARQIAVRDALALLKPKKMDI